MTICVHQSSLRTIFFWFIFRANCAEKKKERKKTAPNKIECINNVISMCQSPHTHRHTFPSVQYAYQISSLCMFVSENIHHNQINTFSCHRLVSTPHCIYIYYKIQNSQRDDQLVSTTNNNRDKKSATRALRCNFIHAILKPLKPLRPLKAKKSNVCPKIFHDRK